MAGGIKDPRDADAAPWNWHRYRQNRLALKGFQRALRLIRSELEGQTRGFYLSVKVTPREAELLAFQVVDRLTAVGGLDVVSLGMDEDAEERAKERETRRRR